MGQFSEGVERFLSHLALWKGASEHTLRAYRIDLNSFFSFAAVKEGASSFQEISKRLVRQYLASLYEEKKSTQTSLRRLSALRSFFRFALKEKIVEGNPLEEIESPKKKKKLPPILAYAQVEHLFNQPDLSTYFGFRDRVILELFYSSALRLSELVGLNACDFDRSQLLLNIFGKGKPLNSIT